MKRQIRRVFLGIRGGGVLSGSPNPDPRLYVRSIPMMQILGSAPPGIFVVMVINTITY